MICIYVWDKQKQDAYECHLLDREQRFGGKSLDEVVYEQEKQDLLRKGSERAEMEVAINLNRAIEAIAIVADAEKMAPSTKGKTNAERLAGIRDNRTKEKEAMRKEVAFTQGESQETSGVETPSPRGPDWEELTPIQRMLWKDFLGRDDKF